MDRGEPTAGESADLDDEVTVAIWGERPEDGPMEIHEPVLSEIWGHLPPPDMDGVDEESETTWPDLWGTSGAGSRRSAGDEPRRRPPTRGRGDRQPRFVLPESWVAPPQQRSPWRQRLHRP